MAINMTSNENSGLLLKDTQIIVYEDSYTSFIDVLGFKEIVLSDNLNLVSVYYDAVNEAISDLSKILENFGTPSSQIMSDSIVFVVTPNSSDRAARIASLRALCGCICHLQLNLALQGIWTRGGISFGKIKIHDNKFVVGPGLIRAIELEKIANFPRVLIEPKILQDLNLNRDKFIESIHGVANGNQTDAPWIFNSSSSSLGVDFEDFLFLNFGVIMLQDFKYSTEAAQFISHHLKKGLYGSPLHLHKYRWLHKYFLSLPFKQDALKCFSEI